MSVRLKEYTHDLGTREDGSKLLRQETIFGHASVAEGLVEWSKKHPGETFEKTTIWGMTLKAAANGAEPHVQVLLNPRKLGDFLSKLGPTTMLCIIEWGISLTGPDNDQVEAVPGQHVKANIHLGQGDDAVKLYAYDPDEENLDEEFLLGAINLSEDGFDFYSSEELQEAMSSSIKPEGQQEDECTDEDVTFCTAGDDFVMTTG